MYMNGELNTNISRIKRWMEKLDNQISFWN